MSEVAEKPLVIRDMRLDELGFAGELSSHFDKGVKPLVKAHFTEKGAERGQGDFFEGLLVGKDSVVRTVDPDKFLKLYEDGKISRKDYLSAITVKRGEALKFWPENKLDRISDSQPASPSLRITRIDGIDFSLLDAVRNVARSLEDKKS